jgi:hypothetical protein
MALDFIVDFILKCDRVFLTNREGAKIAFGEAVPEG